MTIIADYHTHTTLCGHAQGFPEEYVDQAINIGLKRIGFSDHAPLLTHTDPSISMSIKELPTYHKIVETLQKKYKKDIEVFVGIESDYVPGYEQQIKEMLSQYPYDYVIGSVHFIAEWGFDDPIQFKEWHQRDVNKVYRQYFQLLRQSASCQLFDILAHVDLVKKFDFHPTEDMTSEIEENAKVFKKSGVVIEINSSGLRKPAKEIYPSLSHLKIYAKHHVPIIFGSDAHKPSQVGQDFDQSKALALAAGYKEYVLIENRKITKTLPL